MDCIEAQGLINRFIDDKLDEKALTDFLEHVKHCPSCYDAVSYTHLDVYKRQPMICFRNSSTGNGAVLAQHRNFRLPIICFS